jgi:hypothetical protein
VSLRIQGVGDLENRIGPVILRPGSPRPGPGGESRRDGPQRFIEARREHSTGTEGNVPTELSVPGYAARCTGASPAATEERPRE